MQRITGSRAIGRREALGARHRQTATKIRLEAEIGQGHDLGCENIRVLGEGEGNDKGGGATERHDAYLQSDDVIEDRFASILPLTDAMGSQLTNLNELNL